MSNLATFSPSAFDAANGFFSVAPATFHQATWRRFERRRLDRLSNFLASSLTTAL
jgi:hypothetical protein